MKDRTILFKYNPDSGRTTGDCMDIYNWLLDQDEQIAEKFMEKLLSVEQWSLQQIKLQKEKSEAILLELKGIKKIKSEKKDK